MSAARYGFGGVAMSCVDMPGALDAFFDFAAEGRGGYIACTCTHGIVESQRDERLREILNRSLLTLPDGMPTVWMGRMKGMPVRRVTAPDFLDGGFGAGSLRSQGTASIAISLAAAAPPLGA